MTKKTILVRTDKYLTYEFDDTIDGVIQRLKQLKEAYQTEDNILMLEYETGYGSYGDSDRQQVNLYIKRLETDEEYEARKKEEQSQEEKRLTYKRAQLEQLKKELGEE